MGRVGLRNNSCDAIKRRNLHSRQLNSILSLPFTLPSFETAITTEEDNYGVGKIKEVVGTVTVHNRKFVNESLSRRKILEKRDQTNRQAAHPFHNGKMPGCNSIRGAIRNGSKLMERGEAANSGHKRSKGFELNRKLFNARHGKLALFPFSRSVPIIKLEKCGPSWPNSYGTRT